MTIVSRLGVYGFIFVKIQQVLEDQIVPRRLLWDLFLFFSLFLPCPLHLQIHSDFDISGLGSIEQMQGGDSSCLTGVIQEAGSDSTAVFLRRLITLTLSLNH